MHVHRAGRLKGENDNLNSFGALKDNMIFCAEFSFKLKKCREKN